VPGDMVSLYRARLAREKGAVRKDWGGKLSVALAYPNGYRLGMSNLGYQVVYHLLNVRPDVVAERVFLPEGQEMSLYLQSGKPLLSLESQTPLEKFDLIAFSLSFENDHPHVLRMLEMGRIPLTTEERSGLHPFVMAGGVITFLNPEPLSPFIDFFLMGEAEANLHEFLDLFLECRAGRAGREEVVRSLAKGMKSLYVPSLYHPVYGKEGTLKSFSPKEEGIPEKIQVACDASSQAPVPISTIITPEAEFSDMALIELGRGCGRSCRFCGAGYVYRPPRARTGEELSSALDQALKASDRVGLIGAAVSDIPGVENFMARILEKGGDFSVSSLRAETLTTEMLNLLKQTNQKSVAIAPEAGSERLRRVINKHLTEEQIIDAVKRIAGVGDFSLRLYFMIGLPTETGKDLAEIRDLIKRIKHHLVKESALRGRIGGIKLSVNCFVPKAFTPFQWFGLEQVSSLKDKQKWLKKALSKEGGVKVNFDVPKWAYLQALLSLGDRRVGNLLLISQKLGGDWKGALRSSDVNPDFFVYRSRGLDEVLPWDFIDHGLSKKHLIREYTQALREEESDTCHVGECFRCGVCALPAQKSRNEPAL
jgi:radical SAM superfamily enzyme YgiQ (UPF0313 family)